MILSPHASIRLRRNTSGQCVYDVRWKPWFFGYWRYVGSYYNRDEAEDNLECLKQRLSK